jgi:glycosyltransferase involved in cell wall biosynthesis
MAATPEISVIIPAYNAARTVGKAVDSVLAQTFGDFELLVIDDGSRDETVEVVKARDDARVKCVSTANGGVSAARNHGLDLAAGSYVAFLDADDAWEPAKLEHQHRVMSKRSDVGLCFVSTRLVDDDLQQIALDPALARDDYGEALLLTGNVLAGSASSVLARKRVIDEAGPFDLRLSLCADWDMWLRASVITEFFALDEPLVLYRQAAGTMSTDPSVLERDTFAVLDKFFASSASAAYQAVRKRAYGHHLMVCAGSYLHAGRVRDCLRCAARALITDPRTAGRLLTFPVRWAGRAWRRVRGRQPRDA